MGKLHRNTTTTTEEIDSTIIKPGSVRINVKGAFIVDPDTSTPRNPHGNGNGNGNGRGSPTHHETSDIRLPNHTAVVSHIAVDVSLSSSSCFLLPRQFPILTISRPRLADPSSSSSTSPAR
jgi:type II pantothenate kinase